MSEIDFEINGKIEAENKSFILKQRTRNNFLDSYFWYRGIGMKHQKAIICAKKEATL